MATLSISNRSFRFADFEPLLDSPRKVSLSPSARKSIRDSHKTLSEIIASQKAVYGVNTGFGKLSDISIPPGEQKQLQLNLVRSHAAGVGEPFDLGITRIAMVLKVMTMAKGYSGVRLDVPEQLLFFLNHDILPLMPRQGSVGASGDLAPLAHMALALIGEGEVHFQDRILPSMVALKEAGRDPLELHAKEGISLVNGTQVSTALGLKALIEADRIIKSADIAGALSVEASLSSKEVFAARIHRLKKHGGQKTSALNVINLLKGSSIVESHMDCGTIQDPYSFRCIPHIHGASRELYNATVKIIENEANSVSDNPLIFPNGDAVSSGHFHAEAVAQALDALAISMSEIGAISERRIHHFMKGIGDGIPPFITLSPGGESGFMMAHVTAAALASENKLLAHPASVDSITTSGGQEDIVSMAPWAGRKCLRILKNVAQILAIECLVSGTVTAVFHTKKNPGIGSAKALTFLKKHATLKAKDRPLQKDMESVAKIILNGSLLKTVNSTVTLQ